MKCNTCREMLTAYVKGELAAEELAEVSAHLASCAACTQQSEHLRTAVLSLEPADEAPLIRIVNVIFEKAQMERATNIEIQQTDDGTSHVGYRVEGKMHEVMRLPSYVHLPMVNRLRVMADLLLDDRRVPQEGRIQTEVRGQPMHLRVTIVPGVPGDYVIMHVGDEPGAEAECSEYGPATLECTACRELLTAYLQAGLEPYQVEQVEAHLANCAECAQECEGARNVLAQLDAASGEPIMRLAATIVEDAVKHRASDIHVRMVGDASKVFFRIDGVMHEKVRLDGHMHRYLVNRFKILAGLNLAARDVPQDGRFITEIEGKKLDLRISAVPTATGESLVIRLFDSSCVRLSLDDVYLVGEQRKQLDELLHRPNGLIVVTGPTGSGKTTTLYAILHELNQPHLHCMSVEDPVEYLIEGVTQISVNRQAGVDFRTAMRAIMRQDPDVILCGEIRDRETAELCCQAAMTGHLVLTVLHTNDAIKSIQRLLDIGIPRFVISSSLLGATAQRLLRRVCKDCREEYVPEPAEVAWLREAGVAEVPAKLWRGKGCEACRNTGYRGRVAVYEIFTMDQDVLTAMAVKEAPLEEVEKLAAAKMKSLKQSAAEKILAGETTIAEAMRTLMFLPEY